MSQATGVDRLTLGSELRDMTNNEDYSNHWTSLIASVDSVFDGELGYAANWDNYDNEVVRTVFWSNEVIDFIGIDAYFQHALATVEQAEDSQAHPDETFITTVADNWNQLLDNIVASTAEYGKPIIFTEHGLVPYDRSTVWPNEEPGENISSTQDPDEQVNGYEALLRSTDGMADVLSEIQFWHWGMPGAQSSYWYTHPEGVDDAGTSSLEDLGNAAGSFLSSYVLGETSAPLVYESATDPDVAFVLYSEDFSNSGPQRWTDAVDDLYDHGFRHVSFVPIRFAELAEGQAKEDDVVVVTGQITDPGTLDTFTVLVDWGDGSAPESFSYPAGSTGFSETHQYLDDDGDDSYTISVTVTDDDEDSDAGSVDVTVTNVAPSLSDLSATTVEENGTSTLTGTITDPGTLDTFTVLVDWGDGSAPESFGYPAGSTGFSETHQYPDNGGDDRHTISVTLTDDDGENATGSIQTNINLGVVDFRELGGLNLAEGSVWYQLAVAHPGTLTAIASSLNNGAEIGLYATRTTPPLATSTGTPGLQRLDYSVQAGETFLLKVAGDSTEADLTLANLVTTDGTEVQIFGTSQADAFEFASNGS